MDFTPRVHEARELVATGAVTAMIDLSDGLSRDLRHICEESGVGAEIDAKHIPVHFDAIEMRRDGHSPLEHALHDGEDYELLFTGKPTHTRSEHWPWKPVSVIGRITTEPGIWLVHADGHREPLEPKGWEHTF
jgi:thiamine-monophosphate kinase